ncbi:MAG: SIS domain-containing protein [Chloroflexota bacterium]|nr:SIS domain-containing protein [Chloroflexota bacterium]
MALRSEIGEQPDVAARLLSEGAGGIDRLAETVRARGVAFALIAARGTSDHAAVYAQYALGVQAELAVALATASVISRYGARPRMNRALVLGVSQSGRSPDVVSVVAEARQQGALTAAITNDPDSPLAQAAEWTLPLLAGTELSIAATKTYTAELLVIAMLASSLSMRSEARDELQAIPDAMRRALEAEDAVAVTAQRHRSMEQCVVLGRGFNLATALEWALKLKELTYVRAHAYSTADFQHGPVASLERGGHLLAIAARGAMKEELWALLERLRAGRDARLIAVSSDAIEGVDRLPHADDLPEWLSPITAILPAQLFCYHLAREKGIDWETPRGLNKVTLTR